MDISKEFLKQILVEQRHSILKKDPGIPRTILSRIHDKVSLPHIVVIKGIRRCGKSTLLRQIIKEYYHDTDFFYVNFEDERLVSFQSSSFSTILETQIELFGEQKVFLIDEIQQNAGFESYVRRLSDNGYKFYITGSNANLLSSEISTKLTGRHIDLTLHSFSFNEYLTLKGIKLSQEDIYLSQNRAILKREFDNFLLFGGMPEYLIYNDDEIIFRMYEDIILKDIAVRYGISLVKPMRELYHYLISNICRPFSYRTLTRLTEIDSAITIKNYIHYLELTYFIIQISKFDYSLKKQLINNKKVYVADNAFFKKVSFQYSDNKGWLLENLVATELSKSGELYYYNDKHTCDFILKSREGLGAVQVAYEFTAINRTREINGLTEALKYIRKKRGIIITLDNEEEITDNNCKISILPCWKWLFLKEKMT